MLAKDEEVIENPDDYKRVLDAALTEIKLAASHDRVPGLEHPASGMTE